MAELFARDVYAVEVLLDGIYGRTEHDDEEINVRLAMMLHGDDLMDIEKADGLLDGPDEQYVEYILPLLNAGARTPYVMAPDEGSATLDMGGKIYTVRPLKGREWRLALEGSDRFNRLAAMTGMTRDQVLALPFSHFNSLEDAARPFVSKVWRKLMTGGSSSEDSSGEESG